MRLRSAAAALAIAFACLATTGTASAATNITAVEGAPFSGTLDSIETQCSNATVTSATVTWGDGTTSTANVAVQQTPPSSVATFVLSGTHTYVRYGAYAGTVSMEATCFSQGTFSASGQFNATVTDAPLTATGVAVNAIPGTPFSGTVAHVTDDNPDGVAADLSASIDWGDGTTSAGTVRAAPTGGFDIAGSHTYAGVGQDVISVNVTSSGGALASANTTAIVALPQPPPPVTTPQPPPPVATTQPPAPVVRASFSQVGTATPGRVVLDASASAPAGAEAARYDWKLESVPSQEIVCPAAEPKLQLNASAGISTDVTLDATDATTGQITALSQRIVIPTPQHGSHAAAVASGVTVVGVCSAETVQPVPVLAGKSLPSKLRPEISVGGAPPPGCDQDLVFGAADIHGCLNQIPDPRQLPGGISLLLAGLLCGAKDRDFCLTTGTIAATGVARFAAASPPATSASVVKSAFAKLPLPSYYSYSAIRLDGVDIVPQNGDPILIIPAADAIVSPEVRVYLDGHPIVTASIPLALYVPAAGGDLGTITLPHALPLIGSLPFNGSISISLNRAHRTLPNGDTCQYACAALSVSAELPGVFSDGDGNGLSASGVVTADAVNGVQLDSLEVKVPSAQLAGIGVSDVDVRYTHSNDALHAQATVDLFEAAGDISGSVDFIHGAFQAASVEWSAGDGPGIDLGGPLNIYLTSLGGGISLNPTTISANGTITGGPQVLGCALFGMSGTMTAQFDPFTFDADATGQMLCQNVSHEYFHIDQTGSILIGGQVDLKLLFLEFQGGLAIAGNVPQGHIQADANMSACIDVLGSHCLGAEVVVSDRGIGACADLGFTHAGGGLQFPDHVLVFFDSCDIGKFRSLGFVTAAGHVASGFTIPQGQTVSVIGVTGAGAAPRVTLHGPHGQTIDTPSGGYQKTGHSLIVADDADTHETYFLLAHAAAGRWTITPDPGSVAVTSLQQAAGLPAPNVHVRLKRVGARSPRLELDYRLHSLAGQRVTLVERDQQDRTHVLGLAPGSNGHLIFTPTPLLGSKRTIVAEVTQDGHPREDDVVAHYAAPAPSQLPAPLGLKLSMAGGHRLLVHWRRVAGADAYMVTATLSDHSRRYIQVRRTATDLTAFPTGTGATVEVRGLRPGIRGRIGRAAHATLRAATRRRRVRIRPV